MADMAAWHRILRQRIDALGISDAEAARLCGVETRAFSNYVNGTRQPKYEVLERICHSLGVEPNELLGFSVGAGGTSAAEAPGDVIAEIDARVGAGSGGDAGFLNHTTDDGYTIAADAIEAAWRLPDRYVRELRVDIRHARIIEVTGDSMAPTLAAGDKVMVDQRQRVPSPGGLFVIYDGYGLAVKRLEIVPRADPPTVRVISDNAHHSTWDVPADQLHIIGRVVWRAHRL